MKNKIDFKGCKWYKNYTPLLPYKLGGKWYFWKKIRIEYIITDNGESVPIKTELFKNIKN